MTPAWTPRDRSLLRTAQVIHAYVHDEFDRIGHVSVDFAVPGTHPANRIIAVAPFRLYSLESRGDGTYTRDSGFFFASGRVGLAVTAGVALGRAVGNARRRAAASRNAVPSWREMDAGALCVNQFGFFLRTPTGLMGWGWDDILECSMVEPGRLVMLGTTAAGQRTYLIQSDLAELVFASWAGKRQPLHEQFRHRVWLLPDWIQRYRAVFGAEAFDFTRPYPGMPGLTAR